MGPFTVTTTVTVRTDAVEDEETVDAKEEAFAGAAGGHSLSSWIGTAISDAVVAAVATGVVVSGGTGGHPSPAGPAKKSAEISPCMTPFRVTESAQRSNTANDTTGARNTGGVTDDDDGEEDDDDDNKSGDGDGRESCRCRCISLNPHRRRWIRPASTLIPTSVSSDANGELPKPLSSWRRPAGPSGGKNEDADEGEEVDEEDEGKVVPARSTAVSLAL